MANPFLVLGGIAVGIITASFGVLQVPGWVASAQDASAINDLRMISEAQAASASIKGEYAGEIATLQGGGLGLSFAVPDERVKHFAADGDGWCSVALSDSGRYFAVSDAQTAAVSAETLDTAIAAACGPVDTATPDLGPAINPVSTITTGAGISDIDFAPDGRTAFVAHNDGYSFSVVNVPTGSVTKITTTAVSRRIAVSPDGAYLAVGSTKNVVIYNTRDLSVVTTLPQADLLDVAWTTDGKRFVTVNKDGSYSYAKISIIESKGWETTGSIRLRSYNQLLQSTSDGQLLFHGSDDESVIFNPTDLTYKLFQPHYGLSVSYAAVAGNTLWTAVNSFITQRDLTTLTETQKVATKGPVYGLTASPDNKWLYVRGAVALWVFSISENKFVDEVALGAGSSLFVSPDNRYVLAAMSGVDGVITVMTQAGA